jgi:hypothetical protein
MSKKDFKCYLVALCLLAVAWGPAAAPSVAKEKKKPEILERYQANALSATQSRMARVDIAISRWTTPEQREGLLKILIEEGSPGIAKALQKQEEAGFILIDKKRQTLRYAWQWPQEEGGRVLILATDRPIAYGEAARQARSLRYNVSLIQLRLDKDGTGDGVLALAVEMEVNEEKRQLEIKHAATQPIRLGSVKPVE